ncbi:MAG: MFS transporter [Acidobacteria bacterium]|nr:MFS transporter [Acidobacteriota bacterium]
MDSTETRLSLKNSPGLWWLSFLLFSGMFFSYAQRNSLSVALPFIAKDFSLNAEQKGLLLSAFSWIYCFLQVPSGNITDRVGVRKSYSLGFLFWSLMTALTGAAKGLWSLLAIRSLVGIGQSVAFPASARAVANWFRDGERGTVTAIYLTGVRLGQAAIGAFGAYFLIKYTWRYFFVLVGLLPLIWIVGWMMTLRRWESPNVNADRQKKSFSLIEGIKLLKRKSVLGVTLGFLAYDYAWFVLTQWMPDYLMTVRGFTKAEWAFYQSFPYLAMSVIIILSGLISDWLVRKGGNEVRIRKLFIAAGMLLCCLIVPAGLVADKVTSAWLLTAAIAGLGLATPNTWTLTQAVCEKEIVGTASGLQNFGGNLGGIIAPALTGTIAYRTGSFALALGVVGGILILGMLAYWLLINDKVKS